MRSQRLQQQPNLKRRFLLTASPEEKLRKLWIFLSRRREEYIHAVKNMGRSKKGFWNRELSEVWLSSLVTFQSIDEAINFLLNSFEFNKLDLWWASGKGKFSNWFLDIKRYFFPDSFINSNERVLFCICTMFARSLLFIILDASYEILFLFRDQHGIWRWKLQTKVRNKG